MSDSIKHECGISLVCLRKPLEYYQAKYGTWRYGINKSYLLMEKQHNRGQDGAGIATVSFDAPPGQPYLFRERSNKNAPINDVFKKLNSNFKSVAEKTPELLSDLSWVRKNLPFTGEMHLGHVRYGTFGRYEIHNVHPVWRKNNWLSRNLVMAGNFNLTNVDSLFEQLVSLGQHPRSYSDTVTILENVGHFLDVEVQTLFDSYKSSNTDNKEISNLISKNLDIGSILRSSSKRWDGGYVLGGLIGHGDAFVTRDPWGIRPAFYYYDDEVVVVASERPVIQTAFNLTADQVQEVPPGAALIVKRDSEPVIEQVREAQEKKACSFERIYFSRGSDKDIYKERKKLGSLLTPAILKSIDNDIDNTVFSYIPNTSETSFYGMTHSIEKELLKQKKQAILSLDGKPSEEDLDRILEKGIRTEQTAIKDAKLRTFIAEDKGRDDLVGHVYDITYGSVRRGEDNLVIIDDSIVRGTTLKKSILKILDRLDPKKIVVVSSSPQIRYPDCYGIDMAKLGDFVAFQAAIELLKDTDQAGIINEVYTKTKAQVDLPAEEWVNHVQNIYAPFTNEQVSKKISELLTDKDIKAEVDIVYQTVDDLHIACPDHLGDWYFTGNYPTPGGNKVVGLSFMNYIEGKNERAY